MVRALVGVAIGIGFLAAVVIGAMGQLRVKCEVCMAYDGRRTCEVARASDESHAIQQATSTACAKLSSGVTDGIRCSNTPPISTTCSG